MSDTDLQGHTPGDFGRFLKSWVKNPLSVGAVAPSGRLLAKRMATGLDERARVVELGAGTGTLTHGLLDAGVKPENLHIVERDEHFLEILKRRFPDCPLIAADALDLAERFKDSLGTFDYVISGLPLLLFTPDERRRLISQVFQVLKPRGVLHQFTYGGRCPLGRELRADLGIERTLIGFAALNIPPAFVYRFARV